MKLREFIEQHEDELLDFPEKPVKESYWYYRMIPCYSDPTDFHEEFGFLHEQYEDDLFNWETECDVVREECYLRDSDLCLIETDGTEITDFEEIRKRLEREIVKVDGFDVWVA